MPHTDSPQTPPALAARPLLPERLPLRLQDLPPPAARFCLRVADFLTGELARTATPNRNIPELRHTADGTITQAGAVSNLSLVVGVSGGADSLCLLLVLRWLAPRLGLRLHAAVLDHGLRMESAGEARAVAALCRRQGVHCRVTRADVAALAAREGCGLEDAGRRARYAFFESERRRTGADWICTAHQADDLCEDVLLRLVRGTGWPGLGGMAAVEGARRILRPLLTTERSDIDAFLADLGVQPVRDPSNADPAYRRNRLRHQVLPLLRAENPALSDAVRSLWELARCDADYWTCQLADTRTGCPGCHEQADAPRQTAAAHRTLGDGQAIAPPGSPPHRIALPARTLRGLHRAARLRLYKRMLDRLGPGQSLAASLMALDAAWQAGHGGACVQFPGGKSARVVPVSDDDGGDKTDAGGIEFHASAAPPPVPGQD